MMRSTAQSTLEVESAGSGSGASAAAAAATVAPTSTPLPEETLVIEGWLQVVAEDLPAVVAAARPAAEQYGGRITGEEISRNRAQLKVRLPPQQVRPFIAWLEQHGEITERRLTATDVSKTLLDYDLALENLEVELARLRDLVARGGALADVLAIEKEMARVRGEVEHIKGERRFLADRVAYATLVVTLTSASEVSFGSPRAKLYPGPRGSALVLLDPEGRERVRWGGGAVVRFDRSATLELDIYDGAVVTTFGAALYSDFLGRGRRRFLNPYLGMRSGYAHLDRSLFVLGGEVGVELFKHRYLLVEANLRALGLLGKDSEAVLQAGAAVVIAF